jgi:hypothetical protein
MKYTAAEEQSMERVTRRFVVTKQLQAPVQAVVECDDMESNHIFEAFGRAGIVLHPHAVQNLLARRAEQQAAQRS